MFKTLMILLHFMRSKLFYYFFTLFRLMSLIVKLGRHGLIHGDFNEFNIMLLDVS